ncbi:MAG: hypothetical protein P8Y53_25355 [Pseudolabrys sp.]
MRFFIAIAILAFSVGAASAADLDIGRRAYVVTGYQPVGEPAGQLLVYDWQPGVVVRPYWLPPWHGHHYFPFGRDRWDIHRASHWRRPRPAPSYHRYWSASSGFVPPRRYWPPLPAPRPPAIDK